MPLDYKFKPKPYEDALKLAFSSFKPRASRELVPVTSALGWRVAVEVVSNKYLPPNHIAFYDGYAVMFEDTIGADVTKPVKLRVRGSVLKEGDERELVIEKGYAAYVSSNAPLPRGANAVVREEFTDLVGDYVLIKKEVSLGENVVFKGEDIKPGDVLLEKGSILGAQDLGLLMELGVSRIYVYRKPTIGIIATGDELVEKLERGVPFPDNYSAILAFLFNMLGFYGRQIGIVRDNIGEIEEIISANIHLFDALALVAGASRGLRDYSGKVLENLGEIIFHSTNLRPGKVSGLARVEGKPVFLVPGHIGSAISCLYNIIVPIMSKIYYDGIQLVPKVKARLSSDVEARPGSYTFRTVSLSWSRGGTLVAAPHIRRMGGSTLLTILSRAQGYILIPPGSKLARGQVIEVSLFSPLESLRWSCE